MEEVVIKKKDVDRLAKNLLKEVFNFFQDEYITETFPKMKIEKSKFLNRLVYNHILYLNKKGKENELHKQFVEYFFNKDFKGYLYKKEFEHLSTLVDEAMKDDSIDTSGIYLTLNELNLDEEIDGDLMFKNEAFLDIYRVFEIDHIYLKELTVTPPSKISYLLKDPTDTTISQIIKD